LKEFDSYVGRPVILLVDNATSHVWSLSLRNIKVLSLPPNTTSKLQPLDAGIIASFKRHYRRKQIAWGLDQLDDGRNPYSINQLQAMRWTQGAWNSLEESVFANCWRRTGFAGFEGDNFSADPVLQPMPMLDDIDVDFVEDYQHFVQQARIQNPMSIDDFLNPIDEDDGIQLEMTEEEIVELVKGSLEAESTSIDEDNDDSGPSPYLSLSIQEQITILAHAIALVEDSAGLWWRNEKEKTIDKLRLMQRDCRRQLKEQERPQLSQQSIMRYLLQERD
jgi:hypothetical protein